MWWHIVWQIDYHIMMISLRNDLTGDSSRYFEDLLSRIRNKGQQRYTNFRFMVAWITYQYPINQHDAAGQWPLLLHFLTTHKQNITTYPLRTVINTSVPPEWKSHTRTTLLRSKPVISTCNPHRPYITSNPHWSILPLTIPLVYALPRRKAVIRWWVHCTINAFSEPTFN